MGCNTKKKQKKQKQKQKQKTKKQNKNKTKTKTKQNNNNNKTKQNKTKQKTKNKKKITPEAMRHQYQMYMRFRHCTMTIEKGQTCEGLSSEMPKNKQDKVLKNKKVIDKMKKGQNKKSKTVRGQKAYRTMW